MIPLEVDIGPAKALYHTTKDDTMAIMTMDIVIIPGAQKVTGGIIMMKRDTIILTDTATLGTLLKKIGNTENRRKKSETMKLIAHSGTIRQTGHVHLER